MLLGHRSLREVRVGIKTGTYSKNDGGMLLAGSLMGSDLTSILLQPKTTCPRVMLPTVGLALHHLAATTIP